MSDYEKKLSVDILKLAADGVNHLVDWLEEDPGSEDVIYEHLLLQSKNIARAVKSLKAVNARAAKGSKVATNGK